MERTRAQRRYDSRRKALRKKHLSDNFWHDAAEHPYYDNLHQYSKNKIHCSCSWCSMKSKNCPKIADLRRKEAMDVEDDVEEIETP